MLVILHGLATIDDTSHQAMLMMVQCIAMSMPVHNSTSEQEESGCAAAISSRAVPMVRCNAMAWTDEREGLKVLATRSDIPWALAGTKVVTL